MKNIVLENVFNILIQNSELQVNNKKIEEYCLNLKKNDNGRKLSNVGGWQSNNLNEEIPELNDLFLNIHKNIEIYLNNFNIKKIYNFKISSIWINVNDYKDFNEMHTHSDSFISGVYYVKSKGEKSGSLSFFNPATFIMSNVWRDEYFESFNQNNSIKWSYKPLLGYLYLFPSYLMHTAYPNLENEERISIAFNVNLLDKKDKK